MSAVVTPPRLLGPYCLLRPLAEGGMGAVHIATALDEPGERLCLVKTLKSGVAQENGDEYLQRFLDEARVALCLQDEHLCHVFDAGEADGEMFLAMELIEGVTFRRLAERLVQTQASMPVAQALTLGLGLLDGLHAAHTSCDTSGQPLGVVHRDVSPPNVMVDRFGRVKVIDFGLATSTLKETVTEQAVVMGKMAYMAPEQARGEPVTAAADQYAAAVVFYELLTGDRFYGDLPTRGIWGIVGAGTHTPRAWAQVPADIAPILQRALAPAPAGRWPDCEAFAAALRALSPTTRAERQAALSSWIAPLLEGELVPIDEARAQLRDLPATIRLGVAEATERVRVRLQGQSSPSRRLHPDMALVERTEAVRRARGAHGPATSSLSPSSSLTPVPASASSMGRLRLVGLLASGALVLGGGSIVAFGYVRARSPAMPLPPAPPPVIAPVALPPPVEEQPPSPVLPPPPVEELPPPPVPPPPPVKAPSRVAPPRPRLPVRIGDGAARDKQPTATFSLTPLQARAEQLAASCDVPCVKPIVEAVRRMTSPDQKAVAAATRRLSVCEQQCRK